MFIDDDDFSALSFAVDDETRRGGRPGGMQDGRPGGMQRPDRRPAQPGPRPPGGFRPTPPVSRPPRPRPVRPIPIRPVVPVPIVINPGFGPCFTYDRFGRCCDRFGRCCDQFGRCDTIFDGFFAFPSMISYDDMTDLDFI